MLACLTAVCLLPGRAEADGIATDTLTVKVGYYGMDSSRYVEAGTYHWTELQENLTMYDEAHSSVPRGRETTGWWWTLPTASTSMSCWSIPASI
jgi:hypothetical protein